MFYESFSPQLLIGAFVFYSFFVMFHHMEATNLFIRISISLFLFVLRKQKTVCSIDNMLMKDKNLFTLKM